MSSVWAFDDESNPLAELILSNWAGHPSQHETAIVPTLWRFEIRNVLVINERRNRIAREESQTFLRVSTSFPIEVDQGRDESASFQLARGLQLSFYDAAYLEVAKRNRLPLATLDKALRKAAQATDVASLG